MRRREHEPVRVDLEPARHMHKPQRVVRREEAPARFDIGSIF
jgi:hypothetical protein